MLGLKLIHVSKRGPWCRGTWLSLVQALACRSFSAKPLPEPSMAHFPLTKSQSCVTRLPIRMSSGTRHTLHGLLNTIRLRKNCHHFANDIFKCIFSNENIWILINISLKCVSRGLIDNIPSLVPIMAWHHIPGDTPLSEPMMFSLLTHICVSRPHWVIDILSNVLSHMWQWYRNYQ